MEPLFPRGQTQGLIHLPECIRFFLTSEPLHSLFLYSYSPCDKPTENKVLRLWRSSPAQAAADSKSRNRQVTLAGEKSTEEINQGRG